MQDVQKKVEALHVAVVKELADPELHGVLKACLQALKKECEALDWALRQLVVESYSDETMRVNERIKKDWADPNVQVDPNVPHPKPKAKAKADEPALD